MSSGYCEWRKGEFLCKLNVGVGEIWAGVDTERFNLDLIPTLCRQNSVKLGAQEIRGCYGMST